jgi:hypothetical protein
VGTGLASWRDGRSEPLQNLPPGPRPLPPRKYPVLHLFQLRRLVRRRLGAHTHPLHSVLWRCRDWPVGVPVLAYQSQHHKSWAGGFALEWHALPLAEKLALRRV